MQLVKQMDKQIILKKINLALNTLYDKDIYLINNNLCERCIAHRLAMYLEQENFGEDYYVDCEYNKAYSNIGEELNSKMVNSKHGNYIDIVITKRDNNPENDLACFEIKRNGDNHEHDIEKLKILTGRKLSIKNSRFNYLFGFFIVLSSKREDVSIKIFERKI